MKYVLMVSMFLSFTVGASEALCKIMGSVKQHQTDFNGFIREEKRKMFYVAAYLQLTNYWQVYTILMSNEQFRTWAESLQKKS